MKKKTALIIVDIQNDFLPKGALGVHDADEILPLINRLVKLPFDVRVASQDWHPPNHCSFASTWHKNVGEHKKLGTVDQTLWPDHCIQNTLGAAFSKELDISHFEHFVHKGVDPSIDSYSTFFDNARARSTGLETYLKDKGVYDLYIAGLTTEYCILYSVLDALELGFRPHVVIDACRGIDLVKGDVQSAIDIMKEKGIELVSTDTVAKRMQK